MSQKYITNIMPHNRWISCPKPKPNATTRLFCLPYGGGGASIYRHWSDYLPDHIEVMPFQLPGRENRLLEPAIDNLNKLVDHTVSTIAEYQDKPFALFGHSLGAKVAFEVTRKLRRRRLPKPVILFVAGQAAPRLTLKRQPFHNLPDQQFIQSITIQYNAIPKPVLENPELLALMMPALRGDFCMNDQYSYIEDHPLDCPITAFGAEEDPEVTQDGLQAWQSETTAQFSTRLFPGDHFFINSVPEQIINAVAQELRIKKIAE